MPELNAKLQTHYDLLGVKPTASPQQIRQAFRELSKLYHPDTTTLPPAEATEKFQQLNEAYGILSRPDRRWSYDQQVGFSRISVMQPLEPLARGNTVPSRKEPSNLYLDPTDRPLSAGEIFALFILGLTFVACLALVVTVGFTRGDYSAELIPTLETQPLESSTASEGRASTSVTTPTALPTPNLDVATPESFAPALPLPRSRPSGLSQPTWL